MATSLATTVTVCCIFYTLFNMDSRSADVLKIFYACAEGHVTKQKSNTDTYILPDCCLVVAERSREKWMSIS